jgi:octaprenyl-diphosphate synthase
MPGLDKIKAPIAEDMKQFEKYFRSSMRSSVPLLNIITNYVLRRKGKQMRPMFVFLSARLYGNLSDATYVAASLIELLHTATLVHDDVVDNSFERRGFFSIRALWKSKIAVLLGDYLLARGLLLSVEHKAFDLLELVSEAVKEISEGELLQIQKSWRLNINEEEYFNIIRMKTATLIAACTACGCKSVGQPDEEVDRMKSFGEKVGIAFQIKDDLFDYQNNGTIGKPIGNDIQEKKLTLPLIYALEKADKKRRRTILRTLRDGKKSSKQIKEVIDFVKQSGGVEYSEGKMMLYRDQATALLSDLPDSQARRSLLDLVDYTVLRQK